MKKGDLVKGKTFEFQDYGIGIVLQNNLLGFKVYWPKRKVWCYTSTRIVEKI